MFKYTAILLVICASAKAFVFAEAYETPFFNTPKTISFQYEEKFLPYDIDSNKEIKLSKELEYDFSNMNFFQKEEMVGTDVKEIRYGFWDGKEFWQLSEYDQDDGEKSFLANRRYDPLMSANVLDFYYADGKIPLSNIFSNFNKDGIEITEDESFITISRVYDEMGNIVEIRLDKKTRLPAEINMYSKDRGSHAKKIELGNFTMKNGYWVPLDIKHTVLSKSGKKFHSEYQINPDSISFNKEVKNTISLPAGTDMRDRIDGKNYIVSQIDDIKKKEDVITDILEEILDKAQKQKEGTEE